MGCGRPWRPGTPRGQRWFAVWSAPLAESYAQVGRCEEGLTLLAEALALTNDREERRWEAELYRLKGELLLVHAAAHHAEAETCFRHALDIARRQQAKSWELRAATSLSRLWQQQGKQAEAPRSWRRCTTGSPKGLIRRTCRKPKCSSTSWEPKAVVQMYTAVTERPILHQLTCLTNMRSEPAASEQ